MGTRERRERERQETRDMILAAAREMFAEHGYEAVTMRAIAERIEYTPTAIYHHFENKQALVTELCHLDFQALREHFAAAAGIADPVARIWKIGEGYLDFAARFPQQYRFMFMIELPERMHSEEFIAETRGNPERDAYAFLRLACQQAMEQGRWRPEFTSPDEVALLFWATLHGFISLRLVKGDEPWIEWCDARTHALRTMEMSFRGLLRDPGELARIQADLAVVPGMS